MLKKVIFPGTFDPITYGHVDLIERASRLFDHVVIAIAASVSKTPLFSMEERIAIVQQTFAAHNNISVASFSGLLVDFMHDHNLHYVLRGIRTIADMEYEFQLASMNKAMKPDLEAVFLKPDEKYTHISSTIVREIARMGGDISLFVPPAVVHAFKRTHGAQNY
jgi:pantetheine-phosphate adenylyltransferase